MALETLDDVLARVHGQTDVITGMGEVLTHLVAQDEQLHADLAAAIAANDPVKLQEAADQLAANTALLSSMKDTIAQHVAANTPADPNAPPAPPTP